MAMLVVLDSLFRQNGRDLHPLEASGIESQSVLSLVGGTLSVDSCGDSGEGAITRFVVVTDARVMGLDTDCWEMIGFKGLD